MISAHNQYLPREDHLMDTTPVAERMYKEWQTERAQYRNEIARLERERLERRNSRETNHSYLDRNEWAAVFGFVLALCGLGAGIPMLCVNFIVPLGVVLTVISAVVLVAYIGGMTYMFFE